MSVIDKEVFNSKRELIPPHLRSLFFYAGRSLGYFVYKFGYTIGRKAKTLAVLSKFKQKDNIWEKLGVR